MSDKEIQELREENYKLRDYIAAANLSEWFKNANLGELFKKEEEERDEL